MGVHPCQGTQTPQWQRDSAFGFKATNSTALAGASRSGLDCFPLEFTAICQKFKYCHANIFVLFLLTRCRQSIPIPIQLLGVREVEGLRVSFLAHWARSTDLLVCSLISRALMSTSLNEKGRSGILSTQIQFLNTPRTALGQKVR